MIFVRGKKENKFGIVSKFICSNDSMLIVKKNKLPGNHNHWEMMQNSF